MVEATVPLQVLFLVFGRLDVRALARAASVCRAWSKVARDDSVWATLWPDGLEPRPGSNLREAYMRLHRVEQSKVVDEQGGRVWSEAVSLVNGGDGSDALALLRREAPLLQPSTADVVQVLFDDRVNPEAVGRLLCASSTDAEVRDEFLACFDFAGEALEDAYRSLATRCLPPADRHAVRRLVAAFAARYYVANLEGPFASEHAVKSVTLLLIVLHGSLESKLRGGKGGKHRKEAKGVMSKSTFVERGTAANGLDGFPTDFLEDMYDAVVMTTLEAAADSSDEEEAHLAAEEAAAGLDEEGGGRGRGGSTGGAALTRVMSSGSGRDRTSSVSAAGHAARLADEVAADASGSPGGSRRSGTVGSAVHGRPTTARPRRSSFSGTTVVRSRANAFVRGEGSSDLDTSSPDPATPPSPGTPPGKSVLSSSPGTSSPRFFVPAGSPGATGGAAAALLNGGSGVVLGRAFAAARPGTPRRRPTRSFVSAVEKSGFLLKQTTGLVKRWERRWFVVRRGSLYYYKSPDAEAPLVGVVSLSGLTVSVETQGKRACIRVASKDDEDVRTAKPTSGGSVSVAEKNYILLSGKAGTIEEAETWATALRDAASEASRDGGSLERVLAELEADASRTAGGGGGGGGSGVGSSVSDRGGTLRGKFGRVKGSTRGQSVADDRDDASPPTMPIWGLPLRELCQADGNVFVPRLVAEAIRYLEETALDEEGLLRLSGSRVTMDALRRAFETGMTPVRFTSEDPHVVSGLLKQYFRELPEPLVPPALNRRAATIVSQGTSELATAMDLRLVMDELPDENRETLKLLVRFLARVAAHSGANRMHKQNVLTVMVPTLRIVPALISMAMDVFEVFFDEPVFPDDEQAGRATVGGRNGRRGGGGGVPALTLPPSSGADEQAGELSPGGGGGALSKSPSGKRKQRMAQAQALVSPRADSTNKSDISTLVQKMK